MIGDAYKWSQSICWVKKLWYGYKNTGFTASSWQETSISRISYYYSNAISSDGAGVYLLTSKWTHFWHGVLFYGPSQHTKHQKQ